MDEIIAAKKHFSKLGWFFVAGIAVMYLVEIVLVLLVGWFFPRWLENANISLLLGMVPMYLAGFPLLILLLKKKVPAEKIERHRMTAGQYVLSAIICLGLAYASNILGNILTAVVGLATGKAVENQILSVATSVSPWLVLVYMVLCAPVMEEYIFRKLIVDRTVRYGQGVAVVISGLMFGLFHGNLNQFVYAAVIGMFLAYLYVKTGNLKITISLHMLFNFIGGLLSTQLIKMIDFEGYMEAAAAGDLQTVMSHIMNHLAGWVFYALFAVFVFGMLIAGIVLFIVFAAKRRFTFDRGEVFIPKELRFNIAIANSGMLVFSIFWIVQIVRQLFA